MQHQPKKIENQYQAQRKFDKIVGKYFDATNGQVLYVARLSMQGIDDVDRYFQWAFLLSEMRKDVLFMEGLKRHFPKINDPKLAVMEMHNFLNDKYYSADEQIKQIYDSEDMKRKIRVHLAFQAGRKKEFEKLMKAEKIKPYSESTALTPSNKIDAQTKYEKLGKKYFGDSADKRGAEYGAESKNAQQESKIREFVLCEELIKFKNWIHSTSEIDDKHGYEEKLQEKLQEKINSMSSDDDKKIQNKAEERIAYQDGRKKQYFKLKMAGRLEK